MGDWRGGERRWWPGGWQAPATPRGRDPKASRRLGHATAAREGKGMDVGRREIEGCAARVKDFFSGLGFLGFL